MQFLMDCLNQFNVIYAYMGDETPNTDFINTPIYTGQCTEKTKVKFSYKYRHPAGCHA